MNMELFLNKSYLELQAFLGPLLKVGHHFIEQESQTILLFKIYLF